METLTGLLKKGQEILVQAGIEEAGLDARLLLEYITGKSRAYYLAHGEECVTKETADRYLELVTGRSQHIPLQHLTHQAFFMGYEFYVNEEVLIPRQDTETLVEEALRLLKGRQKPRVLDMCTGSGCIIISMVRNLPNIEAYGGDISRQAINAAKENAKLNQTAVIFERSNLYEAFSGKFDVIVSNPPYIPSAEIPNLMPEVRDFEPHQALDGLEDGLYFYRKIIAGSVEYLNEDGILCLEIGCEQASAVTEMMKHFGFKDITVVQDLAGLDRVVRGHL